MKKNIGMDVKAPEKNCQDKNCPFHGQIVVRGRCIVGKVKSAKASKTATIVWSRKVLVKKYERYETKRSKVKAHNPDCIDAKEGSVVKIAECRPISKTKKFCIVEVVDKK